MKQMDLIEEKVSETFGIDIKIDTHKRIYVNARACFYHLCAKYVKPKPSLRILGEYVGRDHATALHGLKKRLIYIENDNVEHLHREAEIKVSDLFGDKPNDKPMYEHIIDELKKELDLLKMENEVLKKKNRVKIPEDIQNMLITLDNEDIREFCETRVRVFMRMKLNDKNRMNFLNGVINGKQLSN